ncbi:MAG: hypothetical protein EB072_13330 [Betaproteobacteria bacterium]|nr:hypothetical protein [Betaproteobacteria bacterium]
MDSVNSVAECSDEKEHINRDGSKAFDAPLETVPLDEPNGEKDHSAVNTKTVLAEYVGFRGPPCHDPRTSRREQIAEGLKSIVLAEGPVQVKRAFDIYLRSCGIKRMGQELRDSLLRAITFLKQTDTISSHKYISEDDSLNEIIWLRGTPSEVLRKRGDRSLEEIPLGELFAISHLVAKSSNTSIGSEEHLRTILAWLDLKRLTSNAENILKEAIGGRFHKVNPTT